MKKIFALLWALIVISGSLWAQEGKITVDASGKNVEAVLNEITSQSGVVFSYEKNSLNVQVSDKGRIQGSLSEVLDKLFAGTGISWKEISAERVALTYDRDKAPKTPKTPVKTVRMGGRVTDNTGLPVVGAVVLVSGTTQGTMTDEDGNWSMSVPEKGVSVEITCMGYATEYLSPSKNTSIQTVLHDDNQFLEDAVVIGYGVQKKEMLIGSVSQVTSKDLMKAPTTNVSSLLAGRLSGVTTIQTSGTPGGDSATLLVRGVSTFNSSTPLVIIDGVEGLINYLNPNDIASVTVLKDASTAAIYGVRGANGVILVTTKSGGEGETKISYDGSATFTNNTAMPEFCNAEQYIYYHNLARTMDGYDPLWTDSTIAWMKEKGIYAETDWQKEIYNNFGFQHQHNISATGGTKRLHHYTSIGFMDQEGILKNTDYNRINIRSNIEAKLADGLSLTLNMAGYTTEQNLPGYSIAPVAEFSPITAAYYALPILATTYEGLSLAYNHGTYYRTPLSGLTDSGYQRTRRYNFDGQAKLEYDFSNNPVLKGLKAQLFGAYNFTFTQNSNFMHSYEVYRFTVETLTIDKKVSQGISENSYSKSASFGYNYTLRPQIDYSRTFGLHSISATVLGEASSSYSDTMTSYKRGYFTEFPVDLSLGMTQGSANPSGSHAWGTSLLSFASRLDYSYDGKYLVGATLRADGSSKFAPGNRWGYFPSVAFGWVTSKEDFFAPLIGTVDFFKLKASYGVLGSDDTSKDLYYQTYSAVENTIMVGGSAKASFYSKGYVHDDLTWSRTHVWNAGVESKLFGNKLSIDADVFYKYTSRILEYDSTGVYSPSLGGYYPTWMNSGRVDNRGFDLTVRHDNWFSNGISYNITGILSWSRNRVLSKRTSDNHPSYRAVIGEPIGSLYGFHALGLFQTDEEALSWPTPPSGYSEAGSIKYQDVNGDGALTSGSDYVKIGRSQIPEMTFSLNAEVSYKGWTASMLFQGATLCNYMLAGAYNNTTDNTIFTRAFYGGGNSILYLVEDAWRPDHTSGKYPRLASKTNASNAWASDFWMRDGSYLRLKNAQISYTIPASVLKRYTSLSRVMVYVAGTNLLTFSAFKYLDPENPGIANGYYPQQRTVSLGMNITF